jgi:hypothetical protein
MATFSVGNSPRRRTQHARAVVQFTRRLAAHHATCQTFARKTHAYDPAARALYAGGEVRAGDRRRRPALAIKVRLMAVD